MIQLNADITKIEEKLLGTWTRRPALRAAWTPDAKDFYGVQAQAVARACAVIADLSGNDLGNSLVAALAKSGDLQRHWKLGEPPVSHDDLSDPIAALDAWRAMRALAALQNGLANALVASAGHRDPSGLRGLVHEALAAAEGTSAARSFSDGDLMRSAIEASTQKHVKGAATGFPELDRLTGGLRPGHVFVFGATTNWGKTSWMLAVLNHCQSVLRKRCLFVSCEDDPVMLGQRLLAIRAELPGIALRDANLTKPELQRAHDAAALALMRGPAPMMLDGRGRAVESLVGDIRAAVRAHDISVVFVDYLQAIVTERDTDDRRGEVNHIARELTTAITSSGCAGVFASQVTDENIRESKDVENAAQVVIIGRKDESGARSLFLKKNKTGPNNCVISVDWDEVTGSFVTVRPPRDDGRDFICDNEREEVESDARF